MQHRAGKEGVNFRAAVNLHLDRTYLPELDDKIKQYGNEWFLGGCILGFTAPCENYPVTGDEYRLQSWLIFEKLFPETAEKLVRVMKETTGFDLHEKATDQA